ncbi:MAG TPA: prenyltransferase [Anaerolineaceae bacterium]|nr:prenyltransferase [Anaerolineaceae bacterium]
MKTLRLFLRLSRPLFLLGAALTYALGVGIARYLGTSVDWGVYVLGQAWVTAFQLSAHYLSEYFAEPDDGRDDNQTLFSGRSGALGPGKLPRAAALWAGVACLAAGASLSVLVIGQANYAPAVLLLMGLIFVGAVCYSVPPLRLEASGYGELTLSLLVANLVPTLAFLLQAGELHRLLAMATFPLTVLHLAMLLAFDLPDYASDLRCGKRTLMVRAGWQRGMLLHNILVLSGFILLGLAAAMGLALRIVLPTFFVLPAGLLQIWLMMRIEQGDKPNWSLLALAALTSFGLTAYLLAYGFWTR